MKSRLIFVALLAIALLSAGFASQAMAQEATTNGIALGAGESTTVPVRFWCLDFGKPFPTEITGPTGRARQEIVNVLMAAQQQGVVTSDPYQVQLAVWQVADGTFHDVAGRGHALAQQLINDAASVSGNAGASGRLMLGAANAGGLQVTVENLTRINDTGSGNIPAYSGRGTLRVQNTGSQSETFDITGAVFKPVAGDAQTLVAEAVQNTFGAASATATTEAMGTVAPMSMATATTTAPTETAAPTQAAAAPAEMPTAAPTETATAAPTATLAATSTAAPAKQAFVPATGTPSVLPVTGGRDANGLVVGLFVLGLMSLLGGLRLAMIRTKG